MEGVGDTAVANVEVSRMIGQVAGHLWEEQKRGFLSCPGNVLKPMDGERGQRELAFYTAMTNSNKWFLCQFRGVKRVQDVDHLILSDLRNGMKAPCVMDLKKKVGRHCYTPFHGQDKIDSEMKKYCLQAEIGFRCAGLRLEDEHGEEVLQHRKEWGRAITSDTVHVLFDVFFGSRICDALEIYSQVCRLKLDVASDFCWSLYAGSVLILRDAAAEEVKAPPRVALVDFSYAFPERESGHDNLLYGLECLAKRLKDWIDGKADEERARLSAEADLFMALRPNGFEDKVAALAVQMEKLLGFDGSCAREQLGMVRFDSLVLAQRPSSDEQALGFSVWDGARELASWLKEKRPDLVRGQKVLELGAGPGLVSLVCEKLLGAASVISTDLAHIVVLAEENGRRNQSQRCTFMALDWTEALPSTIGDIDLVLGAELIARLYDSGALLDTIKAIKPKNGAILSYQEHDQDSAAEFLRNANKKGFKVTFLQQETKVKIVVLDM